jgi:hypothetical protein
MEETARLIQDTKPPPIFINGVVNYNEMVNKLSDVIQQDQYSTKIMADNTIKINCTTPEHTGNW